MTPPRRVRVRFNDPQPYVIKPNLMTLVKKKETFIDNETGINTSIENNLENLLKKYKESEYEELLPGAKSFMELILQNRPKSQPIGVGHIKELTESIPFLISTVGFRIGSEPDPSSFYLFHSGTKKNLSMIDRGKFNNSLKTRFQSLKNKYYSGRILLEVQDSRIILHSTHKHNGPKWKVLIKQSPESRIRDIELCMNEFKQHIHKKQNIEKIVRTNGYFTEYRRMKWIRRGKEGAWGYDRKIRFEQMRLKAEDPPICLDPSTKVYNAARYFTTLKIKPRDPPENSNNLPLSKKHSLFRLIMVHDHQYDEFIRRCISPIDGRPSSILLNHTNREILPPKPIKRRPKKYYEYDIKVKRSPNIPRITEIKPPALSIDEPCAEPTISNTLPENDEQDILQKVDNCQQAQIGPEPRYAYEKGQMKLQINGTRDKIVADFGRSQTSLDTFGLDQTTRVLNEIQRTLKLTGWIANN